MKIEISRNFIQDEMGQDINELDYASFSNWLKANDHLKNDLRILAALYYKEWVVKQIDIKSMCGI